jgi:hypothetical protein
LWCFLSVIGFCFGVLLDDDEEQVVIIVPKPSIARWQLKKECEKLNAVLKVTSDLSDGASVANVWLSVLNPDGTLMEDHWIEDHFEMNKKGYDS